MRQSQPQNVGPWKLENDFDDFVSWGKELSGFSYGPRQTAVVWVEESATGDGYIAWAKVEPEGGDTHVIVDNGDEVARSTAVSRAQYWMKQNPDWPDTGVSLGLE